MAQFVIPDRNLPHLAEVLEKLNKRARKLKCEEAVSHVLATEQRQERKCLGYITLESAPDMAYATITRTYYTVEVSGYSPKIPGWTFMGTIEHTEAGNILRSIPGQEIPESYRHVKANCDHCKKSRSRKDTYVVRNEAGEPKQVGHSCVRDYLGHVSPEQLAYAAQWIREVEQLCVEDYEPRGGRVRGVEINRFLSTVTQMILEDGYRKGIGFTAYIYLTDKKTAEKRGPIIPTQAAHDLLDKALAWVDEQGQAGATGYIQNLFITSKLNVIETRHANLLGSMIFAYQKAMDQLKPKEKVEVPPSEWFGEIKKRYDLILTLKKKLFIESLEGGGFYVLVFNDEKGNAFKWVTGNGHGHYEGSRYKVRGTIKGFETFREVKQTIITRCSTEEIRPEQKENKDEHVA